MALKQIPPPLPEQSTPSVSPTAKPSPVLKLAGAGCGGLSLLFICCGIFGILIPTNSNTAVPQGQESSGLVASDESNEVDEERNDGIIYAPASRLNDDADFARILSGDQSFLPLEKTVGQDRAFKLMAVCVYDCLMGSEGKHVRANPAIVNSMMRAYAGMLGCQRNSAMRYLMEVEPDFSFNGNGIAATQYGPVTFKFSERYGSIMIIDAVMIDGNVYSMGNR